MPTDLMAAACRQLDATIVRQLGAALGKRAGGRARARVASAGATLEAIVEQLGGELSLGGFGALNIERWGQALVARIDGYPLAAQGQELLAGFVEAALLLLTDREVTAFPLERTPQSLRLLLCSRQAAAKVKGWLLSGSSWGDALATLQSARQEAGGRL
jgi:hypothetical protein